MSNNKEGWDKEIQAFSKHKERAYNLELQALSFISNSRKASAIVFSNISPTPFSPFLGILFKHVRQFHRIFCILPFLFYTLYFASLCTISSDLSELSVHQYYLQLGLPQVKYNSVFNLLL